VPSSATTRSGASGGSSSSVPAYNLTPQEEQKDIHPGQEEVAPTLPPPPHIQWEKETLQLLKKLQRLLINVQIEPCVFKFLLDNEENVDDELFFISPSISCLSDAWKGSRELISIQETSIPIPTAVPGQSPLLPFPWTIHLNNMECGMFLNDPITDEMYERTILPPTSVVLSVSMKSSESTTASRL